MKNANGRVDSLIKAWNKDTASQERLRLKQDPYHQIEFTTTICFLEKYSPKQGVILDAGGGPGRYQIELARHGYDIVLVDLVPEMLEIARKQIVRASRFSALASSHSPNNNQGARGMKLYPPNPDTQKAI